MTTTSKRLAARRTPTQERSIATRDRLLDAAARVFARHGYAAGTTNRIAEEAGASVGSLYQYFPNKDAILVALARRHVTVGAELLTARLAGSEGLPLADRLEAVIDAVVEAHAEDPALHQVLFEQAPRPPELLEELRRLEEALVTEAEAMLRAEPAVHVADPAMAARLVVAAIESLVHRYVAGPHRPLDLPTFRSELSCMLQRYLGLRPQTPAPGDVVPHTTG